jgi:L-arabinose isomerase
VARQLWTPKSGLKVGATQWIENGGGHHTVFSTKVTPQQVRDLATMFDLKYIDIK